MLSGGVVLAQTPTPDPGAVPSAQDLLMPAASPAPEAPAPAANSAPAPVVNPPIVVPSTSEPELAPPESSPAQSAEPVKTPNPIAGTPEITLPENVVNQVQTLTPQANTYIDKTNSYNLGATTPSTMVFSERSTGCQAVVRQGQAIPGSICERSPAGSGPIARSGAGLAGQIPAPVALTSVQPLELGSIASGIAKDYFNLTQRPLGFRGNGDLRLMFPLSIPVAITSAFGWRVHPLSGLLSFHYGTDLGAPMGTPVIAAYTGRVAIADFMQGYGLAIVMRHTNPNAETLYGHLSEIFVQPGDFVKQGQVIGRVGSTGNSTGPHLHFEFREQTNEGWVALDPGAMLQTALANFTQGFQLASTTQSEATVIAFGLDGFEQLLKAIQENPNNPKLQQVKPGKAPIVVNQERADLKNWNKGSEAPVSLPVPHPFPHSDD
jgi:murein DD-endopeptidase MepM/ murein hydrolase activator NlpD